MQIINTPTKNYYNNLSNNFYNNTNIKNKTPLNYSNGVIYNTNIKFEGLNKEYFINLLSKDPIKKFKYFTKEEYLKLTENQKNRLREEYKKLEEENPYIYTSMGEIHAYAADCIKQTFDKRFGKNNYVVLPIGRSLSSIGKALAIKIGEENVVNVPLSSAGRFLPTTPTIEEYKDKLSFIKNNGIDNLINFLEEKHLTKQNIETSNKHYILTDYCVSGFSLQGAEQLFKSNLVWGNKKNNIHAVDFIKILDKFDNKASNNTMNKEMKTINVHQKLERILYDEEYKPFATIGRAISLNNTTKASKIILNSFNTPRETKLAWFNIIDTIITNKSNFQVKYKTNELEKDIWNPKAPKQKVEIWNNVKTQYKSDLINDINEISKILIEIDSKYTQNNRPTKSINDIKGIYNYLIGCYKNQNNIENRFGFYEIRGEIHNLIEEINNKI